jgi:hypothetical protein
MATQLRQAGAHGQRHRFTSSHRQPNRGRRWPGGGFGVAAEVIKEASKSFPEVDTWDTETRSRSQLMRRVSKRKEES